MSGITMTDACREILADIERATTTAVRSATSGLVADLRRDVAKAGLGERFGNMLRADFYPKAGASMAAAGAVRPNGKRAQMLFDTYAEGAVISGRSGQWLAIPTKNVPIKAGRGRGARRRMTPVEVEADFNTELRFAFARGGKAVLILDQAVQSRGKRGGFKPATAKRLASGRGVKSVVMFVLVRAVLVRKRLSPDALVQQWADRVPALIAGLMGGGL